MQNNTGNLGAILPASLAWLVWRGVGGARVGGYNNQLECNNNVDVQTTTVVVL